ncbi:hypothetical protein V8C86DRAFT_1742485 [Haematococcus lacustris]
MFYLAADHPGVRDALFTLLVMAVSPQQLPLRLLAVIQVPKLPATATATPPAAAGMQQMQRGSDRSSGGEVVVKAEGQQGQQGPQGLQGQGQGRGGPSSRSSSHYEGGDAKDVSGELEAAVAWCRRRIVWERLKAQLRAFGTKFCEAHAPSSPTSSEPSPPSLLLTQVAGLTLPCAITRRPGLRPRAVGVTSACLTLSPEPGRGQVLLTWYAGAAAPLP